MSKNYLKKIIAKSSADLQYISACCHKAKISEVKYLSKNSIFLMYLERYNIESEDKKSKINSIINFSYIESVRSKKINQKDPNLILELITIDVFKKNKKYEIVLLFSGGEIINLTAEIIEIILEDIKKIND